jgi:hypothetical protein
MCLFIKILNEWVILGGSVEQRINKIEDAIEQMNSRINTIVRNLEEQERKSDTEIKEIMVLLTSAVEAMSIIRYYDLRQDKIGLDKLAGVLSCLRRIEEIRQCTNYSKLREYALERENVIFSALLELAKHKDIAPSEIFSLYMEKLGKDVLREIVRIEDISDAFGTDEALRWKQLLEL